MNLISQMAAQELTITSQRNIDTVLLQSSQAVDLLSIEDNLCKENQIKDENSTTNVLLTTLKVDSDGVNKVKLKIRTAEGQ